MANRSIRVLQMKKHLPKSFIIFIGVVLVIIFSCKKEIPKVTPTIETSAATNTTANTVTIGGVITSDGGASITECGVCWSTNPNPTITDSKNKVSSGIGTFTSLITNLIPGKTYYIRAYAINTVGVSYGKSGYNECIYLYYRP